MSSNAITRSVIVCFTTHDTIDLRSYNRRLQPWCANPKYDGDQKTYLEVACGARFNRSRIQGVQLVVCRLHRHHTTSRETGQL